MVRYLWSHVLSREVGYLGRSGRVPEDKVSGEKIDKLYFPLEKCTRCYIKEQGEKGTDSKGSGKTTCHHNDGSWVGEG